VRPQVRLLALGLCAELFQRSRTFRCLLSAKFSHFLELVVGPRVEAPLPPPAAAAAALRERALELVERWNADHGQRYPQLGLGYSYLKHTLRLRFPEVDARRAAAAAEEAARQARAQQGAQARYARLLEEWPRQVEEARSVLRQMGEAFALLEELDRQAAAAAAAAAARQGGGEEEEGWEDVAADGTAEIEADGLSAYAADDGAAAAGSAAGDDAAAAAAAPPGPCPSDAVVETLAGLHKLLISQALPAVQAALRTAVRAEVGAPGEAAHAQRERLLRAATDLKAELAAAGERYAAAQLDLTALVQAQQRRAEERRAAELVGALFGSDSEGEGGGTAAAAAAGAGARQLDPAPSRQQQRQPMRDPAAPRQQPAPPAASGSEPPRPRAAQPGGAAAAAAAGSRLPDHVRRSLAARAPVLPSGPYARVWDSGSAPMYVSGHALDVDNHWGPVDVTQELPEGRVDEMFLVAAGRRDAPPGQGQAGGGATSVPPGRAPRPRPQPSAKAQRPAAAAAEAAAGPSAAPASLAFAAGGSEARAAERAYNEAVIGGGNADEQLARALQAAEGGAPGGKKKRERQVARPPVRERLQKKLLTGAAAAAAAQDAAAGERERERERFTNRWENK
jgi:hypothetical protein